MDIILKLKNQYKEKIINLKSLDTKNTNNKHQIDNFFHLIKEEELFELYFLSWKNYSCRFDSILFILSFKLIDILKKLNFNFNNQNLKKLLYKVKN